VPLSESFAEAPQLLVRRETRVINWSTFRLHRSSPARRRRCPRPSVRRCLTVVYSLRLPLENWTIHVGCQRARKLCPGKFAIHQPVREFVPIAQFKSGLQTRSIRLKFVGSSFVRIRCSLFVCPIRHGHRRDVRRQARWDTEPCRVQFLSAISDASAASKFIQTKQAIAAAIFNQVGDIPGTPIQRFGIPY
jgi:hypothetical protein